MMTEEQLQRLLIWLRKPIFDPVPKWIKLDKVKLAKFEEIQKKYNQRIEELNEQMIRDITPILGGVSQIIGK